MKLQGKKRGLLLFMLLMVLVISACTTGSSDKKNNQNGNTSNETKNETQNQVKEKDELVIGFSMATLNEERWQRDRDLFVAKAEELGAKVLVQSANNDDAKQISQSENLISQGVDILVIIPHNADAAATIVKKAHDEGIKVLSYDRLIKNSEVDLYVSFDNEKVGELQAQAIVEQQPTGKYVYIGGADTDNNAVLFKQGAMNVLQPLVEKGDIQIVYDQWTSDWDPVNALANMENALTANNNQIDAVVAANDGTAGGAIQALAAQGLAGKIPVSGQDAELAAVQRIVEGTQTMTVYKPIKQLAETSAELAVQMAKGEQVTADNNVNNGLIDVPSVLLEPIAVTKDNMEETIIADGFHSREDVYKNAE